jgi:hypothetical protein
MTAAMATPNETFDDAIAAEIEDRVKLRAECALEHGLVGAGASVERARAIATRFVAATFLIDDGATDEQVAHELGVTDRTARSDRAIVAALAAGPDGDQLRARLLGEEDM